MPQSLSRVLVHLIFSTKNREAMISDAALPHLHGYMAGVLKTMKCPSIRTGGVNDHVHILFALGRTVTQAKIVEEVKKASSKWMKLEGHCPKFSWQVGYGAFSVSESQLETVESYIANQAEHHRKMTFQDEFRKLLEKHHVDYDEKYVWD